MKIGLIADTQVPSAELSPKVKAAFEGVDLILHAGDILIPSCLDYLEEIAPVKAVETGAERQLRGDSRVVEHHRVVEAEGHSIGSGARTVDPTHHSAGDPAGCHRQELSCRRLSAGFA